MNKAAATTRTSLRQQQEQQEQQYQHQHQQQEQQRQQATSVKRMKEGKSCTANTFSDIVFIVDYIVNFYHYFLKFLVVLSLCLRDSEYKCGRYSVSSVNMCVWSVCVCVFIYSASQFIFAHLFVQFSVSWRFIFVCGNSFSFKVCYYYGMIVYFSSLLFVHSFVRLVFFYHLLTRRHSFVLLPFSPCLVRC